MHSTNKLSTLPQLQQEKKRKVNKTEQLIVADADIANEGI